MLFRRAATGAARTGLIAGVADVAAVLRTTRGRAALLVAIVFMAQAAGLARFLGRELMCGARRMGRLAAFGGDFALLIRVHRSEAAVAGVALLVATLSPLATLASRFRVAVVAALIALIALRVVIACHDISPIWFSECLPCRCKETPS